VVGYEIHEGIIRSAARMTYNAVQSILDGDATARRESAPLVEHLERAKHLAELLNRKRERRGSIDFDLPEPVIEFDENGLMQGITRTERKFAHRLIEEFMLAANESVADYLESHQIASLYRIHEKPSAKRIYDFELMAASFGYSLGVGGLPIKQMQTRGDRRQHHGSGRNPQAIEIPEEIHVTPRMYQKLAKKIAGTPEERILSFLMLRSLKQAKYSEVNEGHFALAAPTYTHFTSPIRRYPDLIVHRILKEVLHEKEASFATGAGMPTLSGNSAHSESPSPWSKRAPVEDRHAGRRKSRHQQQIANQHRDELGGPIPEHVLHDIAEESSQSERRADEAERELMEWKKIKFMQDRVGEDFQGIVLSCTKYGFFVELDDLFIEGLVPLSSLHDDRYMFRDTDRTIVGSSSGRVFRMGQRVHVLLDRIDRQQRRLQFALIPAEGEGPEIARGMGSLRGPKKGTKVAVGEDGRVVHSSPDRSGKAKKAKGGKAESGKTKARAKARLRDKKAKGKRK
jgi:ribonuclease R